MANEALPYMLTVGRLRELIRDMPDETAVALVVPPNFPVDPRFTLFLNVRARYSGGPVLHLHHGDGPGVEGRDA